MLLFALVAYLAVQFAIGLWVTRRIRTEADYLIAGRQLGYPLATFSIFATWFGAESIIGSGGRAYDDGASLASAEPFGYALCLLIMGLVFARPLWSGGLTTLADLFRLRFSAGVERLAAIVLIPSSVLWAAAQVRAFGHVLATTTTGLPLEAAIGIAAAIVILYTMVGGMRADAINDLLQGIVLVVGLLVLLTAAVGASGGVSAAATILRDSGKVHAVASSLAPLALVEEWAIPVAGSVLAAELVSRVIAARSANVARRSSFLGAGMYLVFGSIPVVVALLGARLLPPVADAERIVPAVAMALLSPVGYALFAGGLVAAILSTVDSTLLVASGLLSHNLIVPALRVTEERRKVLIARAGVATFGVVAYLLARHADGVYSLVEQASAFGGAPVLVTVSFGLFSRIGGASAAMATFALGAPSYVAAATTGADYPFLVSLAVSLAAYLAGVLLERRQRGRTANPPPAARA